MIENTQTAQVGRKQAITLPWDLTKAFPWEGAKWQSSCKGGKALFQPLAAHTHLSLRFLEREMERERERDLEKERERDLDPDLEREERDPDLDLLVLDISAKHLAVPPEGNRQREEFEKWSVGLIGEDRQHLAGWQAAGTGSLIRLEIGMFEVPARNRWTVLGSE